MSEKRKIGADYAKNMMAHGANEIAQVLPAFPAQGIQPMQTPTGGGAQEVAQEKGAYETVLGKYSSKNEPEQQATGQDLER